MSAEGEVEAAQRSEDPRDRLLWGIDQGADTRGMASTEDELFNLIVVGWNAMSPSTAPSSTF